MLPASINRIRCIWGRHTFTSRGGGEEIKQGGGTAQLKKTIIFIANLLYCRRCTDKQKHLPGSTRVPHPAYTSNSFRKQI